MIYFFFPKKIIVQNNPFFQPLKWLPPNEIKERYPNINYPDDWGAIFDPSGGILLAHTCLTSVQQRLLENVY